MVTNERRYAMISLRYSIGIKKLDCFLAPSVGLTGCSRHQRTQENASAHGKNKRMNDTCHMPDHISTSVRHDHDHGVRHA
jgi:hypothetical protein